MTLRMTINDVRVVDDRSTDKIFVGASHGTAAYVWPPTISHKGITYRYYANEAMSLDLCESYGGYACYYREEIHPNYKGIPATAVPAVPVVPVEEDEYDAPRVQGVTYMRLCESEFLGMRPNRLYYFTVDKNCPACVKLAKVYEGQ